MNESEITVTEQKRVVAGSCNNCQDQKGEWVLQIDLKGCSFRLCPKCASKLWETLGVFQGVN